MRIIHEKFNDLLKILLSLMLFVMVVVVFLQVLFRFIFKSPLAWTAETATFLLVWITFLGASYAMSKRAHIGVEVVVNLFPKKVKKYVSILTWLVSITFFFIMIITGYQLANQTMVQTSPALGVPMGLVYYVIPVSGLILMFNMTANLVYDLRGDN